MLVGRDQLLYTGKEVCNGNEGNKEEKKGVCIKMLFMEGSAL